MRLDESSLWPAAYDALAKREDAADHFEILLANQPANQLDDIASRLRAAERSDAIERIVTDALVKPAENVQICLWLWLNPAEPPACTPSPLDQLSRLLSVMDEINRDWDFDHNLKRDTFGLIRSAMLAYKCKMFRQAMTEMDNDVAATIKRRVDRSPGLSDVASDELLAMLREDFGQLFLKERIAPWLDENLIWTTQEALDRRQAELKDLIEFKLPANSRAIGAAADLGDLSENSEWQAAIEEQRRLQAKVAKISDDFARARVLHKDEVTTDAVCIGSRVAVKNIQTGEEMELTLLGAWDSDVANRVFSYQTPLAQSLMGKSPGDTATLKLNNTETEYVIERLESGL